jgi:predicted aspartyl protease
MVKLRYEDGLLYTTIRLTHDGKSIDIDDAIIDTGAYHTIILTDYLEKLDVALLDDDELVRSSGYGGLVCSAVRKKIDIIQMEDLILRNLSLDFGVIDPQERVTALVGLDFLIKAGIVIDLVDFTLYQKK